MIPGGGNRNREFYGPRVRIADEVSDEMAAMIFDPQTSGGLFIALPEDDAMKLLADLHELGNTDAAIVGRATVPAPSRSKSSSWRSELPYRSLPA